MVVDSLLFKVGENKKGYKMCIYKRIIAGLFIALFVSSLIYPQFGFEQKEILEFESFQSFEKLQPEGEVKLAFKVIVFDEWHINSNKPNEDYLIPTEIKITSKTPFQIGNLIYPEAHEIKLDFSDVPLQVYEGEIFIGTTLKIPKNTELGLK